MRIRYRLTFTFVLCLLSCSVWAQPSASLFRTINGEARAAKSASRYAEAESLYVSGIGNSRISPANRATLVLNYVDLCFIRGDYRTARDMLEQYGPKTAEQSQRWIVRKATVNYFMGNYEIADSLYSQASRLDSIDAATRYELAAYQGAMWMDRKDYRRALSYLDDALSQATVEQQIWALRMEKVIPLAESGSAEDALQLINDCISWFSRNLGTSNRYYQVALRKKAEVLLLMNRRQDAISAFKRYVNTEKEYAKKNFNSKPEQWRLDFWKSLKPNVSEVFALENDCPDFLLDVALFRREVALLGDAGKAEMNRRLSITGQKVRQSLKAHELAIDFVRYEKDDSYWYGAIIVPSSSMRKPIQFVPLWREEDLHGYLVDNRVRLDDALCSSNMNGKDILYTDTLLMDLVWNKLDGLLEQYDYEDVYFAPDGLLHLLAIEYLREDNGVFLHRLTSLSRLTERDRHTITGRDRMLAAGGLDYNAKGNNPSKGTSPANHDAIEYLHAQIGQVDKPFAYLSGARVEIDSISRVSPFRTDTTTVQSEEQLKQIVSGRTYNILHLSTHGYSLDVDVPRAPEALRDSITEDRSLLASGIALTGANVAYQDKSLDDGIISAREFCEMDMSGIDLLVLSACQTGLGRFDDEGPAGLVRGLKKAGAGSLVVSLWSVSDEATMLFMKHLYRAMREQNSLDVHAAFNAARINFSRECKVQRRFDAGRMVSRNVNVSFNLPRYCNSFILIDAIK